MILMIDWCLRDNKTSLSTVIYDIKIGSILILLIILLPVQVWYS